jgi:hypothetical protein
VILNSDIILSVETNREQHIDINNELAEPLVPTSLTLSSTDDSSKTLRQTRQESLMISTATTVSSSDEEKLVLA